MKTKHIKAGQALIKQGEQSNEMYILEKGRLAVSIERDGTAIEVGEIGEKELVGEISFLDKEPRSATVKATVDSDLIEIPRDKFEEILKTQPAWVSALIRTLSSRLRETNKRLKI